MNKIEIQFDLETRNEFEKGFPLFNEYFNGRVLPKGMRVERSLLNNNFELGPFTPHKNRERVNSVMEMIENNLYNN